MLHAPFEVGPCLAHLPSVTNRTLGTIVGIVFWAPGRELCSQKQTPGRTDIRLEADLFPAKKYCNFNMWRSCFKGTFPFPDTVLSSQLKPGPPWDKEPTSIPMPPTPSPSACHRRGAPWAESCPFGWRVAERGGREGTEEAARKQNCNYLCEERGDLGCCAEARRDGTLPITLIIITERPSPPMTRSCKSK